MASTPAQDEQVREVAAGRRRLIKLRSRPAAGFRGTASGVRPPWTECGRTWLYNAATERPQDRECGRTGGPLSLASLGRMRG